MHPSFVNMDDQNYSSPLFCYVFWPELGEILCVAEIHYKEIEVRALGP